MISTYEEWLKFTKTQKEFFNLIKTLRGIPDSWITWVEIELDKVIKRDRTIYKPLEYRLSVLWRGIILLQEAKFICDVLENTLRQIFAEHSSTYKIRYIDLHYSIPRKDEKHEIQSVTNSSSIIKIDIILKFSFYQLTETMARNWKIILSTKKVGFGKHFISSRSCSDLNAFRKEMRLIRISRNDIAHSKRLFTSSEIQKLYETAIKWLTPLEIDFKSKIMEYRLRRPNFLADIILKN